MAEGLGGVRADDNAFLRVDQPPGEHAGKAALAAEAEHVGGGSPALLAPPTFEHALDTAKCSLVTGPRELRRGRPALSVLARRQAADEPAASQDAHAASSRSPKTRSTSSANGPSYATRPSAAARARSSSGRSARQWTKRRSEMPACRVPRSWPSPRSSRSFSASSN